ncbi:type II toxin-antitoxin system VapB family antitoxin [Nocardia sp. NPDC051030]|uniref:type II toxin-antitoxin system VapB family antitoxin n=1 Tax=Nocardia sp. NPDC051030 TaxID=3155162 RepID=UPI0034315B91
MAITRLHLDDEALRRTMAMSGVHTEQDAVNLALRFFTTHATPEDLETPIHMRAATA